MPRHGTRNARLLALALAAALFLPLVFLAVGQIGTLYRTAIDEYQGLQAELLTQQRAVADIDNLRQSLKSMGGDATAGGLLMAPASDAIAVAGLQTHLQALIRKNGALLSSVEALPAETHDKLRKVGLRLQFTTGNKPFRAILHELQFNRPVMVTENVFIYARSVKAVGVERPLFVKLDVFSYLRAGPRS